MNADVAKEISEFVRDLENKELGRNKEEEIKKEDIIKNERQKSQGSKIESIDNKGEIKEKIKELKTIEQEKLEKIKLGIPKVEDLLWEDDEGEKEYKGSKNTNFFDIY